uniref:Gag-Pol polyprotein n=1 Tax=Tanacetum cinerariifolium TaxID=118510 RepID=A0A6L2K5T2_TANCI|nr:Gag-Pol polyprotein [Tanacetum cinerariifolium]
MELVLMDKAFKLNYSTPTKNNQRISSNPRNKHIAQPGYEYGSRQTYADDWRIANQNVNQNGNGNVVVARSEGNGNGNGNIRNQTDRALVYDSNGSAEAKSREELYFSNTSKMASLSKSISIPNEELSDDTSPSVARKFLNEIDRFQAQLGDLKDKSKNTPCVSDTFDLLSQKLEAENVPIPQQNGVVKRRNHMLVEAARTIKPDISFLHVFGALCYPKNNREDIRKLGAKGDIGFFIGYFANSCAYKVYNRITDNVPNAMFDGGVFKNPFASPSTSVAESSSLQYVDPSNMHMFYQPYPFDYQYTKDHPLEEVIGEHSRPVLTRNRLRTDGDMCIYAMTVSTMELKNVKEAMTNLTWIDSMQEELI